ncbi:MAG: acyl-CoA dehydrogenase family protein [Phycisphaeraceae bacterium]|nr:acyl-CoA dehydrogenase family protein [Phycisphaeraceae bacterium]
MADLKTMKGISERDRAELAEAEKLLGPEPNSMGIVKNYFWGRVREDLLFPYPEAVSAEETARCDQLLAEVEDYLRNEHPATEIDQNQEIPRWVVDRLFKLGVLGMTISKEHGGLGMGITSYNRVLEMIGRYCGSTAVLVSAHQSIGCKAILLFGTDEQKQRWLPHLATDWLSAFCLSEPNVGCDAGGQETRCEKSEDGEFFILNGEKKWATSGAISAIFTVMAKQKMSDGDERVTALVCTPDMEGVDIYQKNRSKCGIRGTWQARIRFNNVRVPKANVLHKEGKGLNVALSCLNYGRCTLSAGMLGGARRAMDQAIKWSQTRYQFQRPLAEFELMRKRIAHMSALVYAMDAVLYATTGFLDRKDEDIMVETAICKVFCSEMGWQAVNDAVQIMGGESYMSENEIERIFRDSRINLIVEGANEVMQRFIFGYGGKQLAEYMLPIKEAVGWDKEQSAFGNIGRIVRNMLNPRMMRAAMPLGLEVYFHVRRRMPRITKVDARLRPHADRLTRLVRELSHQFKIQSKRFEEKILDRQCVQARIGDIALYIHAYACTLSKLDRQLRLNGQDAAEFERDRTAAEHFFAIAELEIAQRLAELYQNADDSMLAAADAALKYTETLPNDLFIIPERSPNAMGTGRKPKQGGIKQFPGDKHKEEPQQAGRA